MDTFELTLPYPPSNNHYKGVVRNPKKPRISKRTGRPIMQFFITTETKRFQIAVAYAFKTQYGIAMGSKRLKVEMELYPPTGRRSMDIDNAFKQVLDSLQKAGAYRNDSQIDHLTVTRKGKCLNGMLKVRITEFI